MLKLDLPRHWATSEELCKAVRERHDAVLLAFSRGKDSLACWLRLREHGFRVVPYNKHRVPGLEFVEESLRYYEGVFKTPIDRVQHPSFVRQVKNYLFQRPAMCRTVWDADLPTLTDADIEDDLRRRHGPLPIAIGVRYADSLMRRTAIKKHGSLNPKNGNFYPVWDVSTKDVYAQIEAAGIKLPPDYAMFGRTFDGVNFQFLGPLKERYPRDYERILEWFPLAEVEIARRQLCPSHR